MWKKESKRDLCNMVVIGEKCYSARLKIRHIQDVLLTHLKTHRHVETHTHAHTHTHSYKYTCSLECANFTTHSDIQYAHTFRKATEHTHTDCAASLTREYDDSVMTPTTSFSSFTLLSSFSQPSSLAVHITLPDSRGESKGGWERRSEGGRGGMRNYKEGVG